MGQRTTSAIDRVTVFPGAAWVTRTARVRVAGRTELALAGLPPALDDDTVQIAVRGPARAADVRVTVEVIGADDPAVPDDGELHGRRRAHAAAQAELSHVQRQLEGLTAYGAHARSDRDEPAPAWADAVAARLGLVEMRAAREPALRAELAVAERAVEDTRRALAAAEQRWNLATSAQLPPGSVHKTLEITIEPEGDPGEGGEVEVVASYLVPGAQWAPSYVVRLGDPGELRLELRASIAQATGEDWTGVAVEVSTAAPQRWVELPELPALRVGRAQPPPARAGWRPPPAGIETLFADWDRSFAGRVVPAPVTAATVDTPADEVEVEVEQQARARAEAMLVKSMHIEMLAAPSQAMPASRKSGGILAGLGGLVGSVGGGAPAPRELERRSGAKRRAAVAADRPRFSPGAALDDLDAGIAMDGVEVELAVKVDLLAYASLRMRGPREPRRGTLRPLDRAARWRSDARAASAVGDAVERAARVARLTAPSGYAVAASGSYDYAFAADARLDVPADGTWHNVALLARPGTVAIRHVAVPAVAPEVFRVARFDNPLDAPLLAGPVDVYDRGELVVTGALDETAPGAAVELGLGVDPSVKTARNARFREEAAGVLRGALKLVHEVTISVENLGARPVHLEVRERLPQPAPDEEDLEVHVDRVSPTWETWKPEPGNGQAALSGGRRWRLEVPAAGKRDLQVDYHVRIASKHELVGGNRREP